MVRIHVEPDDDVLEETGKLTADEQRDLDRCERIIVKNKESCYQFALALEEIMRRKLFRGQFKSFAEYCKSVHGLGQAYAYREAAFGRLLREDSPMGENAPASERQARKMIAAKKAKTRKPQVPQQGVAPLPAIHAEEVTEAVEELASAEDGEAEAQEVEVPQLSRKIIALPTVLPNDLKSFTELKKMATDAYNISSDGSRKHKVTDLLAKLGVELDRWVIWERQQLSQHQEEAA